MKNNLTLLHRALVLGVTALFLSFPSTAQETKVKDHSTMPDRYVLLTGQQPNSLYILPMPPEAGSIQFLYDKAQYAWGKSKRDTARGEQAREDANVSAKGVAKAFSEAFGVTIDSISTPKIYTLVTGIREDAGDLATRDAKNRYNRKRPFSLFEEDTCLPEQQEELSTNGSYPSGHTSIGWATALVLAEINPDRQNEILKRGYEMGQSRVICGYHFQSDVDAGHITGSAIVARLHADENFMKQLAEAKKEFARLKKEGKVAPSALNLDEDVIIIEKMKER